MVKSARCVAALAALVLMAPAAPASAAGYDCDASALRASVLGATALEPLVANRGAGQCRTVSNTLAALPAELPLLSAQAAVASTSFAGDTAPSQRALATGGLADLKVKVLPELPLRIPAPAIADSLGAVTVPLLNVPPLLGLTLPTSITVDLRPAINALLPDGKLPNLDVVGVKAAIAYAAGACVNGQPKLAGASQVAGITVLGQELPLNAAIDQAVSLVDTSTIDLSTLDLSKIVLPAGFSLTDPVLGPILQASLQPVLDALPDIQIPATLAQVKITPGEQTVANGRLTQRALRVQVSALGQSLADVAIGEASVAQSSIDCSVATPPGPVASDVILACTTRKLVLTDVLAVGGRVRLEGVADKALAGRRAAIRLLATGKTVANAVIQRDGSFSATAPLPPRSIRTTNRARYQAAVGSERSLDLKLVRRMIVTKMEASDGEVTIAGRVVGPLAKPVAPVYVERRVSCSKTKRVGKVTPRADGSFKITVDAPDGQSAAVYRLSSRVRARPSNPKTFPTYTLPRGVSLR